MTTRTWSSPTRLSRYTLISLTWQRNEEDSKLFQYFNNKIWDHIWGYFPPVEILILISSAQILNSKVLSILNSGKKSHFYFLFRHWNLRWYLGSHFLPSSDLELWRRVNLEYLQGNSRCHVSTTCDCCNFIFQYNFLIFHLRINYLFIFLIVMGAQLAIIIHIQYTRWWLWGWQWWG